MGPTAMVGAFSDTLHQTSPDVVIVNYNTAALLRRCLQSFAVGYAGTVVVVDNGSSDGSTGVVGEFASVGLIEAPSNLGFGAAANLGIAATTSPFIAVLNADVEVPDTTMTALGDYLCQHPTVGVVGPRLIGPDGHEQASCARWPSTSRLFLAESGLWRAVARGRSSDPRRPFHVPAGDGPVEWVLGAVLVIRREALGGTAAFDPRYFLYFEEVDLCARLSRGGWTTHWVGAARAIHVGGASSALTSARGNLSYFRSFAVYQRQNAAKRHLVAERITVGALAVAKGVRAVVRRRPVAEIASWGRLFSEALRGWP